MDERATDSFSGTVDAHPAVSAGVSTRGERPAIDGASAVAHDEADLTKVLQAIAARIDVVLDEKVAAGAEPEGRHRAARAWSSVVGKRATDTTLDLRRHALSTTVLRISADGRVDVDDRTRDAGIETAEANAETEDMSDRQPDTDRSDVQPTAAVSPQAVAVARDEVSEPSATATTDRSDVEVRLRAVRERLASRHASVTSVRAAAPAPGPRVGSTRGSSWSRAEIRPLIQRVLIGLAIVGASAIVSILIT